MNFGGFPTFMENAESGFKDSGAAGGARLLVRIDKQQHGRAMPYKLSKRHTLILLQKSR